MNRTNATSSGFWSPNRLAAGLGTLAGLSVLLTLGDPGITVDEPLYVRPGRMFVSTLWSKGWHFFDRDVVADVFRDNAEHPPLGRWILGTASTLGEPFDAFLGGPDTFSVHAGRLAPALAFAILVGLISHTTAVRYGNPSGFGAGIALLLMPRMFAHAHLGALDTLLCLFWTAALITAERALNSTRTPAWMLLAGMVWGLAILTKIHAWLLPPILLVYTLSCDRSPRRIGALAIWGVAGLVVFFAGWPWLWYDTIDRLRAYWGSNVDRTAILVQYFGRIYKDRDVPWHYPWFYFAATVPVGLHVLGALGSVRAWRMHTTDSFPLLVGGSIVAFLILFSTNVPAYDGERLFLVAFPLWSILIGLGFGMAWQWAGMRLARRLVLLTLLAGQGYGLVALHPFGLSYYNALVAGLPGAERLGLELTYWGDAVDRVLLDELAHTARRGQTASLIPTLHHLQPQASMTPSLFLLQSDFLREADAPRTDWLVVYRRPSYWNRDLPAMIGSGNPIAVRSRQGVWLSAVWPRVNQPADAGGPTPHP
jgi:4-amino-4-deoxy-L-arabinose transferase-like glycosyltransferase